MWRRNIADWPLFSTANGPIYCIIYLPNVVNCLWKVNGHFGACSAVNRRVSPYTACNHVRRLEKLLWTINVMITPAVTQGAKEMCSVSDRN
jgi:hypothetical protein